MLPNATVEAVRGAGAASALGRGPDVGAELSVTHGTGALPSAMSVVQSSHGDPGE
ncbi:hypothetical protein [Methylorubrum extorquens]